VERPGMGEEKLDNTVYTIRGLSDLADLAQSKGDTATRRWASSKAADLQRRFDKAWWFGPTAQQYADSLDDPGNVKVFQRHWIGVTPVEAEIKRPGHVAGPLAPLGHANTLVQKRQEPCYTGTYGLYHTGTGATTDPKGNPGPTCDSATSSAPSDREVFSLNTSIMAVAEAALGRMGADQLRRYTTGNAQIQLDPSVWELPGAMPEIAPSPDFKANIDQRFTQRSSAMQAWGTYGILWPVVHFQLGVSPDMGRNRLAVVPQVPNGQSQVSGRHIKVGNGSISVTATRSSSRLTTLVGRSSSVRLTIGALLPSGARVKSVTLDGHPAPHHVVQTARGRQVRVNAGNGSGTSTLVVALG
jgi:hypothetical protein